MVKIQTRVFNDSTNVNVSIYVVYGCNRNKIFLLLNIYKLLL